MSEEEIIESVKYHITLEYMGFCNIDKVSLQGLLDLYNKEKDKNASLKKQINLMKSININDNYISKDKIKKLYDFYKNTGYYELEKVLEELLVEE